MTKRKVGLAWLEWRMEALNFSSMEQAAQACGINRGTLYRYFAFEQRPSIDVLPSLCDGLQAAPLEVLRALKIQV
jgi:hypothetical protein